MKITFIGIGKVGFSLADKLQKLGYPVGVAAHDPGSKSLLAAQERNPALVVKPPKQAVADADVVFLATPFQANRAALAAAGDLENKVIIDCTNPIGPGLSHALNSTISAGEQVQAQAKGAHVVKAFNTYGYKNFLEPSYPAYRAAKPAMLIAGDDPGAKQVVSGLCEALGWDVVDTGGIEMSLHLEHLALLWIKMSRQRGSGFVWAMLER